MTRHNCVVIGAGPAGLSTAGCLQRAGIEALVVDRAEAVASSWRARYDGFRLNTSSWFSYLPGQRLPRDAGRWPSRDALVAYYESYTQQRGLELQLGTVVGRIDHGDDGWRLETSSGDLEARFVVIATGKYHTPVIPPWPGKDEFGGELFHSVEYRNAAPYQGRDVLVVGPGASGCEIATQLATGGARKVWLSVRTPPHIVHRDVGPFPVDLFSVLGHRLPVRVVDALGEAIRRLTIGDLAGYGLHRPPDGIYTRLRRTGMVPTIDGPYVEAVKKGLVEVVSPVERFERARVVLADGSELAPDPVIAATGFRRNLEPLVGHLGLLGEDGHPSVHGHQPDSRAPRLYFLGFSEPFSGNLRQLRLDARRIARAISRQSR